MSSAVSGDMNAHVSLVHVTDYEIEIKDKVTNTEIDSKSKKISVL